MNQAVIVNGMIGEGQNEELVRKYFKHFTATYTVEGSAKEEENGKKFYLRDSNIPVFITSESEEAVGGWFKDYVNNLIKDDEVTEMVLNNTHTIHPDIMSDQELLGVIQLEKDLIPNKDRTYFIYRKTKESIFDMVSVLLELGEDSVICYDKE